MPAGVDSQDAQTILQAVVGQSTTDRNDMTTVHEPRAHGIAFHVEAVKMRARVILIESGRDTMIAIIDRHCTRMIYAVAAFIGLESLTALGRFEDGRRSRHLDRSEGVEWNHGGKGGRKRCEHGPVAMRIFVNHYPSNIRQHDFPVLILRYGANMDDPPFAVGIFLDPQHLTDD